MKKTLLLGCSILGAVLLLASCNKEEDQGWKTIPQDEVSIKDGNAHFTVNGVEQPQGSVKVVAKSSSQAQVTLSGIVPGYDEVIFTASLKKGDNSTYTFSGVSLLTDVPSIATLKSEAMPQDYIYRVAVEGDINTEGVVNASVTTQLSDEFKGGLEGSWPIKRVAPVVNDEASAGPLWINWTFTDSKYAGATTIGKLAGTILGGVLANYLDEVTFNADGNITAKYWEDSDSDEFDISKIFEYQPVLDEKTNSYVYGNKHDDKWIESPAANYAFWLVRNGMLYIVPNLSVLSEDGDTSLDMDSLSESLQSLKAIGVDVNTLTAEIMKILENGVALKYSSDGNVLKVYVDKSQCDPIVKSFIPALPVLDKMLADLEASESEDDQQTVQMIKLVLSMLGLEKPSDFEGLWNATETFEIELNFTK